MGEGDIKIVTTGSRSLRRYFAYANWLRKVLADYPKERVVLIQGDALYGGDRLIRIFAKRNGYRLWNFPADWDGLGRKAGMVRNAVMVKHAMAIVGGWDGVSRGTKNCLDHGFRKGLPTRVFDFAPERDYEDRNIKSLMKYRRLGKDSGVWGEVRHE